MISIRQIAFKNLDAVRNDIIQVLDVWTKILYYFFPAQN